MLGALGVGVLSEELGAKSEFDTQRAELLQRELTEIVMTHHIKTTVAADHTSKSSMRSANLFNTRNDYSMFYEVTDNLLASNMHTLQLNLDNYEYNIPYNAGRAF
ncbi:hypothetical protein POVCU2_0014190 [Plasmodium ovale curtisi]|uniref:PIR Superfamily Protein n=1 Tax=Plasmodium ovale curtisi TaxID=864141 RepID=A0A1A8VP48_PLAOA|nr:hypothetical protein POVCU2_0014190 [Plasmodium ovale curtisi]SBT02202.1 hypothetical protein POVCU1_074180 [Plasmodium ovale curtisi]